MPLFREVAFLNRQQVFPVGVDVAKLAMPAHLELDGVAVVPGIGGGDDGPQGRVFDLGDPGELVAQDGFFDGQLLRIVEVLILTAAADGEVRTAWFDPVG